MLSQRVRGAENRAKHRLANGPLRVRSNEGALHKGASAD